MKKTGSIYLYLLKISRKLKGLSKNVNSEWMYGFYHIKSPKQVKLLSAVDLVYSCKVVSNAELIL